MTPAQQTTKARSYLRGEEFAFDELDSLWQALKKRDDLSLARQVLERLRRKKGLIGAFPTDVAMRQRLCREEALLTSKDRELSATLRHDRALEILVDGFGSLEDSARNGDAETLGIAGGILKRRWRDLGQIEDLRRAGRYYFRGGGDDLGTCAYAQINAAFIDDLLAETGDEPVERRARAASLRRTILADLRPADSVPITDQWFNIASRAEALFGLRDYAGAKRVIEGCGIDPAPWQRETTARQIASLAQLQEASPFDVAEIRDLFALLLPGADDAVRSVVIGKVGLALSGGGFRASLYHLGVLARLAELNVLRHVDVLSCVSGGSIVGACYWLALRNRMRQPGPLTHQDYIDLVNDVIKRFLLGIEGNVRGAVQPKLTDLVWRLLVEDDRGALDPEKTAKALEELFYRPLLDAPSANCLHHLPFNPADHAPAEQGKTDFHPGRDNWRRANKVPVLVLNATTVNTGHAWQFTPTWMGESPWAVHDAADSIPRLEWSWYAPEQGWKIEIGRAVAASACVPGVFAPLEMAGSYNDGVNVRLVDGGVHDNQGTVSLLALDCTILIVSDACGQLMLEKEGAPGVRGLVGYANRAMSTLMERVRLANYADLSARVRSGLLRGLMFLHMKAGLDADTIRLTFSQESYEVQREPLSPSGLRKDFQQALAELRTDLDVFTPDECNALMAAGYRMARWKFKRDLAAIKELADPPKEVKWPFEEMLAVITSTAPLNAENKARLKAFHQGSTGKLNVKL